MQAFRLLFITLLTFGVGSVSAQEAPAKLDVAALLKGKLVGLVDGSVTDVELTGDPEYFVLYSSASW